MAEYKALRKVGPEDELYFGFKFRVDENSDVLVEVPDNMAASEIAAGRIQANEPAETTKPKTKKADLKAETKVETADIVDQTEQTNSQETN